MRENNCNIKEEFFNVDDFCNKNYPFLLNSANKQAERGTIRTYSKIKEYSRERIKSFHYAQ